jgi:hypothetical protein
MSDNFIPSAGLMPEATAVVGLMPGTVKLLIFPGMYAVSAI